MIVVQEIAWLIICNKQYQLRQNHTAVKRPTHMSLVHVNQQLIM